MVGNLFVISGPSGSGKSTVVRGVRKRLKDVSYSVSHTTRHRRAGEKEGRDYCFVDRETFERMIHEGAFVEWAPVYHDLYGTSTAGLLGQVEAGLDVLLDLDTQGAAAIRERFPDSILIFLFPPSLEVLEARLRSRGTDQKEIIEERLKRALGEMEKFMGYDYAVINKDLDPAIEEVKAIVLSERCRVERAGEALRKLFDLPDI
jgi:guanylate kinase